MPGCAECGQKISLKWLVFSSLNNVYSCEQCGTKYKWGTLRTILIFVLAILFVPYMILLGGFDILFALRLLVYFCAVVLVMIFVPGQYSKVNNEIL